METSFDFKVEAYDGMIDWPKRLATESIFYRWLFDRVHAKSVLDAACGTGRHAAMFADWGMVAQGADLSTGMIQRCQALHVPNDLLSWQQRSFCQPPDRKFDVVICTGNSLALVDDLPTVDQALGAMMQALNPGGALVVQVVNLFARSEGPTRWDRCKRLTLSTGDALIARGIHRSGDYGYVDFLQVRLDHGRSELNADSVRFLGLRSDALLAMAQKHQASNVEIYGNFDRKPFDSLTSGDLLMVAFR